MLDELIKLTVMRQPAEHLEKMARFLADVPAAWEAATPEQRNKLTRCLFGVFWLKDKQVIAVKPNKTLGSEFLLIDYAFGSTLMTACFSSLRKTSYSVAKHCYL